MAGRDDAAMLRAALVQLQKDKGEADGMLQLLRGKLKDVEEENFDLRACMVAFETETKINSEQNERALSERVQALESQLSFKTAQLQNAERVKLRALREADELQKKQEKQLLERKKLDAEKRLLATKRRKQESFLAASQSILSQQSLSQQSKTAANVTEAAVQTDVKLRKKDGRHELREENAELVSALLAGISRDLLTLFNGTGPHSTAADEPEESKVKRTPLQDSHSSSSASPFFAGSSDASMNDSMNQSASGGVPFSQSVFSQIAGRASAQAHASLMSATMALNATQISLATDRARKLYDVLGKMLAGHVTAVALAPVFVKYLAAPTDMENSVICSVLQVMYSVMHHSTRFQQFLLVASSSSDSATSASSANDFQRGTNGMEHPRISFPGLRFTSLDDYLSARSDTGVTIQDKQLQVSMDETASEGWQLRSKLMSALCRVIKNNLKEPRLVSDGLSVIWFWADLGFANQPALRPDFKPLLAANVIPAILLAPKGPARVKAQAIGLLSQLLCIPDVFSELEPESKKSLLFNRCVKMLVCGQKVSACELADVRTLQHEIVKLLLSIITLFPSVGIRFVLESTRGFPGDSDGHRSAIYYLAQLLHHETFEARTTNGYGESYAAQDMLKDPLRIDLIRDAFTLLGLLSRYVDLPSELDGSDQMETFRAVLGFLSTLKGEHTGTRNDSIAATAQALIAMIPVKPEITAS